MLAAVNRGDDDNEGRQRTEILAYGAVGAQRAKKLGRYTLERIIAQGGMAEIWLASVEGPSAFPDKVVVKRIRPELVQQAIRQGGEDGAKLAMEMFVREARVLASLEHDNIVQVFEFGVQPSRSTGAPPEHFIVMEALEGLSLRDLALRLWQANRPLPVEAVVRIVADACQGLEHAHRLTDERGQPANLVHRDISPDNIFVTTTGVTKLLDFGIAKREDWSNLTLAGELKGKVPYMAPEQLKGLRVDGRTDLFAVGVVLYWLLAGRRPCDGPSDVFTMKAILDDDPTPLRTVNPRVPALVADVVMSCLAKEPEQRISSAAALHDALSIVLVSARGRAPDLSDLVLGAMELPDSMYEFFPEIAAAPVQQWPGSGQSRTAARPSFDPASAEPSTELVPDISRRVKEILLNPPRPVEAPGETRIDLRTSRDGPVTLSQIEVDNLQTDPPLDAAITGEEAFAEQTGPDGVAVGPQTADPLPPPFATPPTMHDAALTIIDMQLPAVALARAAAHRFPPPPPMTSSIPSMQPLPPMRSSAPPNPSLSLSLTPPQAPTRARSKRRRWRRLVPPLLAGGLSALLVLAALSFAIGFWDVPGGPLAIVDAGSVVVVVDAGVTGVVDAGGDALNTAVVVDAGGDALGAAALLDAGADAGVAAVALSLDAGDDAGIEIDAGIELDAGIEIDAADTVVPGDAGVAATETVAADNDVDTTGKEQVRRPARRKPPVKAVKAVKPARGKGFLVVRARPWAKVTVDNVVAGTTPLPALSLKAGRHRVRLEHEGIIKNRVVEIVANTTATVQVDMREP